MSPPKLQQLALNFLATFSGDLFSGHLIEQQPSYICTRPDNFTIRNTRPLNIREAPLTGGYGGLSTGSGGWSRSRYTGASPIQSNDHALLVLFYANDVFRAHAVDLNRPIAYFVQ